MAITTTAHFIAQFAEEVKQAYQQKESKLKNSVRTHTGVIGSTYTFPILGKFTTNSKTRNGDLVGIEPAHSQVSCTLVDSYAPIYLDNLDTLKTNVNLREEYAKGTAAAINRAYDLTIITAAVAGSNLTATTAGGWTYAKHLEAFSLLNSADVDESDRFMVVSPRALSDMMNEVKVTSGDYMALMPVQSGQIGKFMGFNVISSTLLPVATNVRTVLYFNKSAIGCAVGQEPQTKVDWVAHKNAWLINTTMSLGSVIVDPQGVVEMPCSEV